MAQAGTSRIQLLKPILRPLIRFCLRNSVALAEVLEATKVVFAEVAASQIEGTGNKVTVSRIAVMTGMTRREVTRIYKEGRIAEEAPSLAGRVLVQWEHDPEFSTKQGKAKVLTCKGSESEFSRLVETVSKDVNAATLLYELERLGAVEQVRGGVKLVQNIQFHTKRPEKGINLLFRDIETLSAAAEENVLDTQEIRNLHLRTEFDNILLKDMPRVRKWLLKQGQDFHKKARDFLSQYDKDLNQDATSAGGGKVVLGAFSFAELPDAKEAVEQ
ncbi:MAG: hypothetical protein KDD66_14735 [Bdellovibrionales bacterium]|nr:hypothetical protein [Bdellovibrionales bacterium]